MAEGKSWSWTEMDDEQREISRLDIAEAPNQEGGDGWHDASAVLQSMERQSLLLFSIFHLHLRISLCCCILIAISRATDSFSLYRICQSHDQRRPSARPRLSIDAAGCRQT